MTNKKLTQIQTMIDLQDQLNCRINPDWINAGNNWRRAAWVECAELIDHIGYKWWKKQTPNIPQAQIELVDIFHFILSEVIVQDALDTENTLYSEFNLAESIEAELSEETMESVSSMFEDADILRYIELLASALIDQYPDYITIFGIICEKLELSFDKLYIMYISKNVLNVFRQDNGYNEGTYIKSWPSMLEPSNFVEDNVYLETLLNNPNTQQIIDESPEKAFDYLYNYLEQNYPG